MLRRAFQATENLGSLTVVLASELQMKGWHRFFWRQVDRQNHVPDWCLAGRLTEKHT